MMNKELENTLIKNYEYSQGEDLHFLQKLADDPGFILKSFLPNQSDPLPH